jgi:hypothetical protein
MFSVMLPRIPISENFVQLLKVFKTSQRIHRLIEFNLVAGANFALDWVRKWHSKPNFNTISRAYLLHKDGALPGAFLYMVSSQQIMKSSN